MASTSARGRCTRSRPRRTLGIGARPAPSSPSPSPSGRTASCEGEEHDPSRPRGRPARPSRCGRDFLPRASPPLRRQVSGGLAWRRLIKRGAAHVLSRLIQGVIDVGVVAVPAADADLVAGRRCCHSVLCHRLWCDCCSCCCGWIGSHGSHGSYKNYDIELSPPPHRASRKSIWRFRALIP